MEYTQDEIIVVCISRQIEDGELIVQGIATPLIAAAMLLARHTHAPSLYFASAIGQGICKDPAPLGVSNIEKFWLDKSLTNIGFVRTATDFLPSLKPKEFFRPAQIDSNGNFNNIAIGKNYHKPKLRLPGTGGIPDVTTYVDNIYLYIPRHSKVSFVPRLDYYSGLGYHPSRSKGRGPRYLVTNLGQFDFYQGRLRLLSFHEGITIEKIKKKTGFPFVISQDVHKTKPPSKVEIDLLRNEIDPLGIRRLELMSGPVRKALLLRILSEESESHQTSV